MKKIYIALLGAVILGLLGVVAPATMVKNAQAQTNICENNIEIEVGTTGPLVVTMQGPFAMTCKPVVITDAHGVTFGEPQYQQTVTCSNGASVDEYASESYDARAIANISTPQTLSFTVEANYDSGGECETYQGTVNITFISGAQPADFSFSSCSPATATITAGSSTSFNISSSGTNGFNSAVTVSHAMSPSAANPPTVSYTNNGAVPNATTTATINTTTSTTPTTYTITFTGSGGGESATCNVQLIVNAIPAPAGTFTLSLSPTDSDIQKGNNQTYTVTATCTNLNGPITNLSASSPFTGLSYSFSANSIACGGSMTLTVSGSGSVPSNQLSTPQSRNAQTITVTDEAAN